MLRSAALCEGLLDLTNLPHGAEPASANLSEHHPPEPIERDPHLPLLMREP